MPVIKNCYNDKKFIHSIFDAICAAPYENQEINSTNSVGMICIGRSYIAASLAALTLIVLILAIYPLTGTTFVTNDDMNVALLCGKWSSVQAAALAMAKGQGRIGFLIWCPISCIPYLFDNIIYFKTVQFGAILVSVLTVGWLLKTVTDKAIVGYIFFLFFISLWQNTWSHNLLSAYPFLFSIQVAAMAASCLLFYKFVNKGKKWLAPVSAILFLFVMSGSELWVLYFAIMVVIAARKCFEFTRPILKALILLQWHIAAISFFLSGYFVYRALHPSSYNGNVLDLYSVGAFFKTLLVYSFGLFPGVQFFISHQSLSWDVLAIVKAVSILILFFIVRRSLAGVKISFMGIGYTLAASIFLIFAPNVLLALTLKYQQWVASGNTNYVYSHFSYFGIILSFVLAIVCSAKKAFFYYAIVMAVVLMSYLSDINNRDIGQDQNYSKIKWVLFDNFLASDEFKNLPENSRILAPSLWNARGIAGIHNSYWSEYALKKTAKNVIVEREGEDAILELQYTDANFADFQYLTIKKSNDLIALYVWGNQCKNWPCYLLAQSSDLQHVNFLEPGTAVSLDGIIRFPIKNTIMDHGIQKNSFIDAPIQLQGGIVLLPLSPPVFEDSISVDFLDGFYETERDKNGIWRWCSGVGTINVKSSSAQTIFLHIEALPASTGQGWLILPDGEKINLFGREQGVCSTLASLKKGDNKLSIVVDYLPVRLNPKDTRSFSFMLRRLSISKKI